jgi:uncharacterized protein (DUF2384 family)
MDACMSVASQKRSRTIDAAVASALAATFTSSRVSDRWLRIPNLILNGDRPIDCLKRNETDRVLAALEALNTGVYI